MPDTLDITQGATPPATSQFGVFSDLLHHGDTAPATAEAALEPLPDQQLIGGGTADASAFQIVDGKFSEVPRAIAKTLDDFGPFSDLAGTGTPPPISNIQDQFGVFADLAPESPAPETQKVVEDTGSVASYLKAGREFGRHVNEAVFGPIRDVLGQDAEAMKMGVGQAADYLRSAVGYVAPGFIEQAEQSPLKGTNLAPDAKDGILARYGKAAVNWATGLIESGTSPLMLSTIAASSVPQAGRAISAAFAAQMGASIPDAVRRFEAAPNGSQEQVEAALGMATAMGFTGLAGSHAVKGEAAKAPVRPASAPEAPTATTEQAPDLAKINAGLAAAEGPAVQSSPEAAVTGTPETTPSRPVPQSEPSQASPVDISEPISAAAPSEQPAGKANPAQEGGETTTPADVENPTRENVLRMSPDQLQMAEQFSREDDKALLNRLFGEEGAKKYLQLERTSNSAFDKKRADDAYAQLTAMQEKLTEAQSNKLFGIGDNRLSPDELRDLSSKVSNLDSAGSVDDLAFELKWAASHISKPTKPLADLTGREFEAQVLFRHAAEVIRREGFNPDDVFREVVNHAASRFDSAENAAFMLRPLMEMAKASGDKAPTVDVSEIEQAPTREKAIERAGNLIANSDDAAHPAISAALDAWKPPEKPPRVRGPVLLGPDGEIIAEGALGETHKDLMKYSIGTDQEGPVLDAFLNDNNHAFIDDAGNVLDRTKGADAARANGQVPEHVTSLQSEDLKLDPHEAERQRLDNERQKLEHEQEQRDQAANAGGSGPELFDAIQSLGGLPSPTSKYFGQYKGELRMLHSNMRGLTDTAAKGEGMQHRIFSPDAPHPDVLAEGLRELGFDIQTPGDLFDAVERRQKTGQRHFGSSAAETVGSEQAHDVFGFGPGAAAEGEFTHAGRKPIRIANADIDAERAARGAEPIMGPARKANPMLWDEAMSRLDRTPQAAKILVDNINDGKVKSTSDVEQAMLLHEEISLRNEKAMEAERAVDPHATEDERTEARANFDALESRIDTTERAARKSGTEAGRALQARQLAVYDDYTHAALETRSRIAKGRPLTSDESAKLKEQADEITRLRGELEKAQDAGANERAMETLSRLMRETMNEAKVDAKAGKSFRETMHAQRDAAKARLRSKLANANALIPDPTILYDAAVIGASHLADGIAEFGAWSRKMIEDIGKVIEPHLTELFERAKELHATQEKLFKPTGRSKTKATPVEKVAAAVGTDKGLTNRMVFDLARAHVQAGVTGLDAVMKAVHADLEPHFPGLKVREVRDMFSDYGKVKFPSKEEDLVKLRDYRRQAQLVSAVEDAQSGLSPKRTGSQRDKPSDTVLELQKQVQEEMKKSGITTAGDPTRLKTNLDRYKAILDRRIAEIERRQREKDYSKPVRSKTVLDNAATAKLAELNQKQRLLDRDIERDRLKNRTGPEKVQDAAVKWSRTAKLASVHIFPKLIEAGLIRIVTNPISRVLSQPLRLIPGLTEKAPAQLRIDLKAEADRIAATLTSGPEAFKKLLGKGTLDALGKKRLLDHEMLNLIGNAHGMIKEPVRQGEFRAAARYYSEQMKAEGIDIREPAAQAAIISNALADANWQIFMGDNNPFSKNFVSLTVNSLRKGKFTGARTLANAIQFVMPIVKVSSNIAVHTARLQIGLPESMIRLATALHRGELADGAAKLSHEDAQAIARSFSAGVLGVVLASWAWNNAGNFGGIYGEQDATHKKNETGLKPNEIKLPFSLPLIGDTMPGWMNHAPEMQFLNTVASARRVYDRFYEKGTGAPNALTEALAFSTMAPVKNLPFIDSWLRMFNDHQSAGRTVGQIARSAIFPGGDSLLKMFDDNERSPQTFTDELKLAIPGLRGTVPTKGETTSGESDGRSRATRYRSR